jgi:hypothetical protein
MQCGGESSSTIAQLLRAKACIEIRRLQINIQPRSANEIPSVIANSGSANGRQFT